ncbi:MAG: carbohydrate ABC transporter permease [Actinomycetia bacterium]|nr:carbohydrate ABC transporter permease [Actinomycetes bacterium]
MATEAPASSTEPQVEPGDGPSRPRVWPKVGWYVVLTALSVVILFPIYMLILRAISAPLAYIAEGQPLTFVNPEWDVFSRAWSDAGLARAMAISAVMTLVIVGAQFLTSVLAAYSFAFLDFPFKRTLFALVIGTLLLPIEVTLIANVRTIRELEWLNSVPGLTFPFLATALGIFLIRQGFMGIPRDLRDAATLDGFGHLGFLFRVAVPLAKPVIGSFLVISFLSAWNQYVWPRNATDTSSWQTAQIALRTLTTERVDQLNVAFAGAIIAALPLVALLIFFQRQMVRGLTAGAVKG